VGICTNWHAAALRDCTYYDDETDSSGLDEIVYWLNIVVSIDTSTSALSVTYRGGSGYYVCSDQWTPAFSDAVCQQLGHP